MERKPSTGSQTFSSAIADRLSEVERPARYIGGEPGSINRDWDSAGLHFALAFPDLYEIGMSYHGREVLYQHLNRRADVICERVFLPAGDMTRLMEETGTALWALESKRPVAEFDVLGISLTYELAYPWAVRLIGLAGIPQRSLDRTESDPLVIAGGQCMCNPEPVAAFFDVIVNGEGEQVLCDITECLLAMPDAARGEKLRALARIPGCYIPSLYTPRYSSNGQLTGVDPAEVDLPGRIERRFVADLVDSPPPTNPVQPLIEVPSDKAYLEVMRGCPQGCRFCQAGYITRPARARSVADIARAAGELARNTGSEEVGMMSLSTLDHPEVKELLSAVKAAVPPGVGVAMPSMRADAMSAELAELLRRPRETSLTIAIESGSESLRQAINKRVTDRDITDTFSHLMAAGWHKFKLYFMCGFSHEDDAAIDGITAVIESIFLTAKENGYRKPHLNVSISVLVPKPHTPLQWQAMEHPEVTQDKINRLRSQLGRWRKAVNLRWHDSEQSMLEALLARGGRELAGLIEAVANDHRAAPEDNFDYAIWQHALDISGINPDAQVWRERDLAEVLPWDHIDRGVTKGFLWAQWQAYLAGEPTPPCQDACSSCGLGCGTALFS